MPDINEAKGSVTDEEEPRAPGRPRSEAARQDVLAAAARLMEEQSVRSIAIEGIAREAGRQKPLIYRHWSSKTALLVDAFISQTEASVQFENGENAVEMLRDQLTRVADVMAGPRGRIAAELMAEAAADPDAQRLVREALIEPRRDWVRDTIARGQESGELRIDLDPEAVIDALYAPFYYRLLVGHAPITGQFAVALLASVIDGIRAPEAPHS